jgi:glucan endo-1,3-alpha-glucosidase
LETPPPTQYRTGLAVGAFAFPSLQSPHHTADIALASSKGLDGFVLNLGSDSSETALVADAFTAAKSAGSAFRLGFSFDMTVMPCTAAGDAALLQKYIATYSAHPNVLQFAGKMFVSTFSGETCTFGQGSVDAGWVSAVKGGPEVCFIPAFFGDPTTFGTFKSLDGMFNVRSVFWPISQSPPLNEIQWNGGWPQSAADTSFNSDTSYISTLGGKTYLGAVSPWFFTHYGADSYNKNWIYNFDDWLFSERWEVLVENRQQVPIVEVITWNGALRSVASTCSFTMCVDYGESHYVGPIEGAQPNSQAWVNGFDHQGSCSLSWKRRFWD